MRPPLVSVLFLLALPAFPQSVTIKKVAFAGAPTYQSTALMSTSGVQPGVSTGDQIRAAAQRLSETGLFSNVEFKFDGETLTYTLTPSTQLLKARFDNFVWWSPAELDQALHSRLPLYNGMVPQQGAFSASIADALTHMLAEKSVAASVIFLPEMPGDGRPVSSIVFQVSTPTVKIGSITVQGAAPALAEKFGPVLKEASNQIYSEFASREYVATAIANVAFENGYMEERLTNFQHGTPVVNGDQISIDTIATIEPGLQYHVSDIVWAGSPVLSKEDFAKLNPMKPGSIASKQELTRGLQSLGGYYYRSGCRQSRHTTGQKPQSLIQSP
jgi:outer membrane protein assembly factor BamA